MTALSLRSESKLRAGAVQIQDGASISTEYFPSKARFSLLTPLKTPFLLSKRQTQRQTPTALPSGPHQFASTPRFNVGPTPRQATLQPPLFSTPAPRTARPRATQYDPLSDTIDSSDRANDETQDQQPLNESIELGSPSASSSLSGDNERPLKRRRVSISPEIGSSPDFETEDEPMMADDELREIANTPPPDQSQSLAQSPTNSEDFLTGSEPPSPIQPAARHPTFRDAPRFKTAGTPKASTERPPLPDAFSPQRRGAKYVPGGLAAEVRDWLVQVKGASEYDRPAGFSVEMTVDEAREGDGMWIVAAHEGDVSTGQERSNTANVILAGDGRIPGLGGKNSVRSGGAVSIYQPMWDIDLGDLGQFVVTCDWEAAG